MLEEAKTFAMMDEPTLWQLLGHLERNLPQRTAAIKLIRAELKQRGATK